MKIIKNITTLLVVILFGYSCSEDFINLTPISEVAGENFYKTESDMEQAVVAAYAALQSSNQYRVNFLYFMEGRSDNSYYEDISQDAASDIDLFEEATTNTNLNSTWETCYIGIQRCNIVLDRIDAIDMDESLKSVRKAEVRFIRALTYFNMVRMWGELPVVLDELDNPFSAYAHVRQPVTEVYDAIIDDLTTAASVLPNTQTQTGRVTRGAALSLLGKVYLTLEQWDNAVTTLTQVEAIGYQILPTYADVFDSQNENNAESIFEIQFQSGGEGSLFLRVHTPQGDTSLLGGGTIAGAGFNLATQDLFDAFLPSDLRRDVTVSLLVSNGRYHTNKYNGIPEVSNDEDNNFMVLRYADVLLMLAEALNEVGYVADGDAFTHLNTIRARAGFLVPLTSADLTTQNQFRDAILLERRLELAFENHRWFDLVRTGKAIEVMNGHTDINGSKTVTAGKHELYAIPQAQVNMMNNLENFPQNPGY